MNLNRYFERIGFAGSIAPTLVTLEQIVAQQAASIPFSSLPAILGERPGLDPEELEERLVGGRRGGSGFELNSLLMQVLAELEFEPRRVEVSRMVGRPEAAFAPRDHMAIIVEVGGEPRLVDVGLGALTPTAPLRFDPWLEQPTPNEPCRLIDAGEQVVDVELLRPGGWMRIERVWAASVPPGPFAERQAALVAEPDSALRRQLIVGLATPDGRREIRNGLRIDYPTEGDATSIAIADMAHLRQLLAQDFGLALPQGEEIDARLTPFLDVAAVPFAARAADLPDGDGDRGEEQP